MAILESRETRILDHLNNYRFHLIDASFQNPVVLNISYGFARVTVPEVQLDVKEIKQGTYEYKKSVVMAANASDIVLEQGVSIFNSDFYDWIIQVIRGQANQRRNLLLIQFSDQTIFNPFTDTTSGGGKSGFFDQLSVGKLAIGPLSLINFNDLIGRVPARVWYLKDCIPIAYKAGSDFDALGNEISISQLTIRPHEFQEFSLGV